MRIELALFEEATTESMVKFVDSKGISLSLPVACYRPS